MTEDEGERGPECDRPNLKSWWSVSCCKYGGVEVFNDEGVEKREGDRRRHFVAALRLLRRILLISRASDAVAKTLLIEKNRLGPCCLTCATGPSSTTSQARRLAQRAYYHDEEASAESPGKPLKITITSSHWLTANIIYRC